ncbi:MAG: hypothetical protein K8J09_04425 [Planctomycetes bacterium]|nr:hypothetical protein [Planctomycetota bacterium]
MQACGASATCRAPADRYTIAMAHVMPRVIAAFALLLFAGCGAAPEPATPPLAGAADDFVAAVVAADPVFGSAEALFARLHDMPSYVRSPDTAAWGQFHAEHRLPTDVQAARLVRELVPAELAHAALPFLRSDAGQALMAAETVALTCYPWVADDFPAETAKYYGDAAQVGDAARNRFAAIAAIVNGDNAGHADLSPSPAQLAKNIGAMLVQPAQAEAIAGFYASPVGQRWLAVRLQALAPNQQRFLTLRDAAREQGLLRPRPELELSDLILPRAEFPQQDDPATEPAIVLVVRRDGAVLHGERLLYDPAQQDLDVLRAALRALVRDGIAAGSLTTATETQNEAAVEIVNEPVLLRADQGVEWRHIGNVMKLAAEPGIGLWKVELSMRSPE